MAKSEQQRQKKLARKRSKEIAKRKQLAAEKNAMSSIGGQISNALQHPISHCYAYGQLFDTDKSGGIGSILISRPIKDGRVVSACFLVDKDCLGVKDAFARLINPTQFSDHMQQLSQRGEMQPCDPVRAKKLVTEAVRWAASFGLGPMGDYERVKAIWSDIDETQCEENFEFGHQGKPTYIQGPHDSPAFVQRVMNTLAANLGDDGFDYSHQIEMPDGFDSQAIDFDVNNEYLLPDGRTITRIDPEE